VAVESAEVILDHPNLYNHHAADIWKITNPILCFTHKNDRHITQLNDLTIISHFSGSVRMK
jgi:hypothetical protein